MVDQQGSPDMPDSIAHPAAVGKTVRVLVPSDHAIGLELANRVRPAGIESGGEFIGTGAIPPYFPDRTIIS